MRKICFFVMMCLPMLVMAQANVWEMPKESRVAKSKPGKPAKPNPDEKYLAGAVPVVDGRVVFSTTINAPGKSANQIQDAISAFLQEMTEEENQFEQSRILVDDKEKHTVCATYQEWLVFKNSALTLDRTRLYYNIIADCKDGSADVQMCRIHYLYEEERNPQTMSAEEWITDKEALTKSGQKLSRISGKFRRKTVDRKNYIFRELQALFK
jgi:colicin import membrane protein